MSSRRRGEEGRNFSVTRPLDEAMVVGTYVASCGRIQEVVAENSILLGDKAKSTRNGPASSLPLPATSVLLATAIKKEHDAPPQLKTRDCCLIL